MEADGLFHNLLGKAFDENFNDVRERLDISERELSDRIGQYLQNKDNFAERLDYRDPHCKDGIYVMAGADA